MDRQFQPLPILELGEDAGFRRPVQAQAAGVTLESPALDVMTDLSRASPATIRPQAPIEGARQFMISRGVRLLLVADDREIVLGVLTATDVLGEKAVRIANDRGLKRSELTAGDIMTPARQVEMSPAVSSLRFKPRSDRKSTRLNSSHTMISYSVFCFKKNKNHNTT